MKEPSSFSEQQDAPLQPELKINAFRKVLKSYNPGLDLSRIDLQSHITYSETFRENLEALKSEYPSINFSPKYESRGKVEKYDKLWEKKKQEWGVNE